ncbi:MAG TPA: NF038122 family metalloprotease [Bryobacteraceae bacterium]|nr:NF038122 family metalloprotease [Bryobacteraceae bacterium]
MSAPLLVSNVTYICQQSDPSNNIVGISSSLCQTLNTTVANQYGLVFSNVNASIYIQYGGIGSAVGENTQYYNTVTYSSYLAALQGASSGAADSTALSNLSGSNPYGSGLGVAVTSALDSALGLTGAHGICINSTGACTGTQNPLDMSMGSCAIGSANCYNDIITISNSSPFYYDSGNYSSGEYDFFTVVEHETDEALGTASCLLNGTNTLGAGCGNGIWGISPTDLFRYIAPGLAGFTVTGTGGSNLAVTLGQGEYSSPDLGPDTQGAYFSIDGGNTALADFYNSTNGPDYGDLATICKHVQDAIGCSQAGGINILNDGGTELAMLDAVGYTLTAQGQSLSAAYVDTPEPSTVAMLVLGVGGFRLLRRRRVRQA